MKTTLRFGTAFTTAALTFALAGCGSEGLPAEDVKAEQARAQAAKDEVELAQKSGGDYDKLAAEDKAKADKLFGDGNKAKSGLARMAGGPAVMGGASVPGTGQGHSAF